MSLIKVVLYRLPSGKIPYKEWLDSFDESEKVIFIARVNKIILGNFGDCKLIDKGIWELRIHNGPGYRIYYVVVKKRAKNVILQKQKNIGSIIGVNITRKRNIRGNI